MNDNVQFARGLVIVVVALGLALGVVGGFGLLMSNIKGASDEEVVFEDNDAIRDDNETKKSDESDEKDKTVKTDKSAKTYEDFNDSLWENSVQYDVGKGKTYPTIGDALRRWEADGYPVATVNIADGEYNEVIRPYSGKTIAFIGESRDGVIIKSTTGRYEDTPIIVANSNVQIRNMTVIADHSSNPGFSYDGATLPASRACAIHVDGGDNTNRKGTVYIENVKAVSYQSAGIVVGLIPDSTVRIENTQSMSYTDKKFKGKAVETLKYGSIICMKSSPALYSTRSTERIELINVDAHSENTANVLYLMNGAKGESFDLFAYKTKLTSAASKDEKGKTVYVQGDGEGLVIDKLSKKNNCEMLNYEK